MILIVKPAFALPAAAMLAALLAGCGQTGPLYMPPPLKGAAAQKAPATPPATTPVQTSGEPAPGSLSTPVTSTPAQTQQ